MNSYMKENNRLELDLEDLMWRLLNQWKAFLLTGLVAALLLSSVMYFKESNEYSNAVETAKADAESAADVGVRINDAYLELSEDEAGAVRQAVWQYEKMTEAREYIRDSAIMNIDPNKSYTLSLVYYIKSAGDNNQTDGLKEGYKASFDDPEAIEILQEATGIDCSTEYFRELLSFCDPASTTDNPVAGEAENALHIYITLPNNIDEKSVENAVDGIIKRRQEMLKDSISPHSMKLISSEAYDVVDERITKKNSEVSDDLNDYTNRHKTFVANLNGNQKAVYETVIRLKKAKAKADEIGAEAAKKEAGEKIAKPAFSKKYFIVGLLLGLIAYACIYIAFHFNKKRVGTSEKIYKNTGIKLLGEYYYHNDKKILSKLLSSRTICERRYGSRMDGTKQAESIAREVLGICSKNDFKSFSIIEFAGNSDTNKLVDNIKRYCENNSVKVTKVAADTLTFDTLSDTKNVVFVIDSTTNVSSYNSTVALRCSDDVNFIGYIFTEEV